MAQDNSSKLSFTIEESVWLNKGQEIDEVISMSLNPDITIEERNDQVQIKGGLRLVGEYRPVHANEKEMPEMDDFTFRSIEEVSQTQDGMGEVSHFFPIDVTIPLSRINNLQDVFVEVESFDYDLPDKSCIQLTADIVISGMNVEQKESSTRTEELPILENDTNTSFEYEATIEIPKPPQISFTPPPPLFETKQENRDEQQTEEATSEKQEDTLVTNTRNEEQQEEKELVSNEQQVERELEKDEQQVEELVRNDDQEEKDSVDTEQPLVRTEEQVEGARSEQQVEVVTNEAEENTSTEEETEDREELEEQRDTKVNIAPLKKMAEQKEVVVEEVKAEEIVAQNEEKVTKQASKPRKDENALYLTKMLSHGEEQFSKLRMCIIQPNESLDMIAERYNISSTQIIRMNRLESERLEEGQILYIPVGKNG